MIGGIWEEVLYMATKNEPKVNLVLEYDGKSVNIEDVSKAAKEDWTKGHKGNVSDLKLYLKPEESKAYYVANESDAGFVDM